MSRSPLFGIFRSFRYRGQAKGTKLAPPLLIALITMAEVWGVAYRSGGLFLRLLQGTMQAGTCMWLCVAYAYTVGGKLPLFTELPTRGVLGNPDSPGPIGPGPTGAYPPA